MRQLKFRLKTLIALLTCACVTCAILGALIRHYRYDARRRAELRSAVELFDLQLVIDLYTSENGEIPTLDNLHAVTDQLSRVMKCEENLQLAFRKKGLEVSKLQSTELLVLLLGDKAFEVVASRHVRRPWYEFDPSRLTDRDGDGWSEYAGRSGQLFELNGGHVVIRCPETAKTISVEYIEKHYHLEN